MILGHYGIAFAAKSVALTFALELAVFVPGLVIYQRTTRAKD